MLQTCPLDMLVLYISPFNDKKIDYSTSCRTPTGGPTWGPFSPLDWATSDGCYSRTRGHREGPNMANERSNWALPFAQIRGVSGLGFGLGLHLSSFLEIKSFFFTQKTLQMRADEFDRPLFRMLLLLYTSRYIKTPIILVLKGYHREIVLNFQPILLIGFWYIHVQSFVTRMAANSVPMWRVPTT